MKTIKVIDLLNKIANGELEDYTKFYDKCTHKTYTYKPKIYTGIYPENKEYANDNWYLTLQIGSSRLLDEVEIIEEEPRNIEVCGSFFTKSEYDELAKSNEDKKIEKMEFCYEVDDKMQNANNERFRDFINEIIDKVNGE